MAEVALPILLPLNSVPRKHDIEWQPTKYRLPPQPPPSVDDSKTPEIVLDGRLIKKTRPRKTVDYFGGMGRWETVRCSI